MKTKKIVEIYFEEPNFAVIRVPSRHYPGVLIQGDSLLGLVGLVKEAIAFVEVDKSEAMDALTELHDELNWRLENYKKVLKENDTPFF